MDRLRLDESRVEAMAAGLEELIALPDPVGSSIRGSVLPNGLSLTQVRVPLGVVAIIYEARPNVTADAAGIALKAGNAVLLRGSGSAYRSNRALVDILSAAAAGVGVPADAIQLVPGTDRESVTHLMNARGLVDVIIPRGGAGLIKAVVEGFDGAGDRDRRRQRPRLRRRVGRPRHGRGDPAEFQDPPAERLQRGRNPAGARRCRADRGAAAGRRAAAGRCHGARRRRGRRPRRRHGARGRTTTGTPSSCRWTSPPRWCRRWTPRWPTSPTHSHRPHRGDRHLGPGQRQPVHRRGRRRRGDGQRLDLVHRRRPVRLRCRDRHLHPEAARPRADGAGRADQFEVRRRRLPARSARNRERARRDPPTGCRPRRGSA